MFLFYVKIEILKKNLKIMNKKKEGNRAVRKEDQKILDFVKMLQKKKSQSYMSDVPVQKDKDK